jgi:outer membrane receptor protein involved in Fe transport
MFSQLAEHTWAMGITYAVSRGFMGVTMNGVGRTTNQIDEFALHYLSPGIRLKQNRPSVTGWYYKNFNPAYATADLTGSYRVTSRVDAVLTVQNLADHYTNDYQAGFAVMGRLTKAGLRIHL